MKVLKSKVNYFDILVGDVVEVVEFVPAQTDTRKDGDDIEQKLDIYKVQLLHQDKIHYLFPFEVEEM